MTKCTPLTEAGRWLDRVANMARCYTESELVSKSTSVRQTIPPSSTRGVFWWNDRVVSLSWVFWRIFWDFNYWSICHGPLPVNIHTVILWLIWKRCCRQRLFLSYPLNSFFFQRTAHRDQTALSIRCIHMFHDIASRQWQLGAWNYLYTLKYIAVRSFVIMPTVQSYKQCVLHKFDQITFNTVFFL